MDYQNEYQNYKQSDLVDRFSFGFRFIVLALIVLMAVQVSARRLNLNKLGKEAAAEVFKCVKEDSLDAEYRAQCIDLLARWNEKSDMDAIHQVLNDKGERAVSKKTKKYIPQNDRNVPVRVAACYALGSFQENGSIPVMVASLKEDLSDRVRVSAADNLKRFPKEEAAVDGLIDALLLEIQKDKNASIPVTKQVIRSLGAMGHKKSFIPLLKVTQVSFPDHVKEDAQQSIDNIKWQEKQ